MNKRLSILFIFLLLFQTATVGLSSSKQIKAEGSKESIFTDIAVTDEEKNKSETDKGSAVTMHISWSTNGLEITAEDSESLRLPTGLVIETEQRGELKADETVIGKYHAAGDTINVTFNEAAEEHKNAEGTFEVEAVMNNSEANEEERVDENDSTEEPEKDTTNDTDDENKSDKADIEKTSDEKDKSHSMALTSEGTKIIENIIDELKLIREDDSEYKEGDFLELGEDLRLKLDWSLPNNHGYKAGDYFEFQLPEQLNIYNEITGQLDNFGSYVVTPEGKVTFTFNENIEAHSDVKGTFWIDTELDKQTVTSTEEVLEVIVNDDVAQKITINIKPENGQAIHKEGQPVDGNFNTEEIEWTVIVNTTRESLENTVVSDQMPEGLELILESIELKEVEVDLQGNVIEELGAVTDFTNDSTLEELNLKLGDTNKAYKLRFKTKIKEDAKDHEGWKSYYNTAYLHSDGKDEKQSGASVSVERPKSLEKTSSNFNKEDRSVEWEVKANFNEKQLSSGDEITDEFTFTVDGEEVDGVFAIKSDDIIIEQVNKFDDQGNAVETSDAKGLFDITIEGNKVTYKLKEDTNKAFIIKYKTKAKEGAYIHDNGEISNTVEIDGKTATSSQGVVQQVGVKGNSGINYEDKTIDWTITINADKQDLRNFVLTDDFSGSGQKLVEGSVKIEPEAAGATITLNEDGEGFVIDFGDITDTYTITYQTEFTYDFEGEKTPNFKNDVNITYTTKDGEDYELEIKDQVDPNQETKSNGVKNGKANNETKEIAWTVDINYNQLTLDNALLIDEIADNQSLVEGSVKIYETTISDNGTINVGDDVTNEFDVTSNENLIEVAFGEIEQSYRVEFITKDKDGIYNDKEVYENTAQFFPREGEQHDLKANVTLPNQGEFLGKEGKHNKEDWTIDWKIDVNKSKSKLTDVMVKDDLGDTNAQILLEDSIKVTKVGSEKELVEGEDYELTIDGNTLSVHFPGEINDTYQIIYSSYIVAEETANITNEAEIESSDEIIGHVDKIEEVEVRISTGGGTGEGTTGELIVEKVENHTDRPLKDVAFKLIKKVGNQEIVVREGTTDTDGKIHWKGLTFGDYTLEEVIPVGYLGEESQEITLSSDAPEGIQTIEIENERQTGSAKIVKIDAVTGEKLADAQFKLVNKTTGQEYTFTTDENGEIVEEVPFGEYTVEEITAPKGYRITKDIDNITIEIDETTEIVVANEAIVEVAGQKSWFDSSDENRPETITVELLANGTKVDEQEVTAENDWTYSFTNLDKYDGSGEEIKYSIEEVTVDGYVSQKDGFNLTNIETINISGEKTWVEVDEQYRPDTITVNLLANGEQEDTVEVSNETDWTYEFKSLAKYDKEGKEITYTIEEIDVPGYESTVDGFDITNTQETTELAGTKTWKDDNATNDRPESIKVKVMNGDTVVQEQEVSANKDNEWTYTFTELPKYDKDGNEIEYTVEEEALEGYEATVEDNDITNVRVGTTEVEITKLWKDEEEIDRPDTIKVNLLQNGDIYGEYEVTKDNNWELIIQDLPKFDEEGKVYEYTIKEHDVAGYASEVDGFKITNTRAETKNIEITKTWLDTEESADRPDAIEVELFRSIADGDKELVETYELTADEDWSLEVKDLPAFDQDGKAYMYEIEEKSVNGYETTINGFDITNLRVGTTEISGTKTWLDDESEDRPESITVKLLANGEETEKTVEVTEDTNWEYTFTELPKYDDQGKEISYTVDELDVKGYKSTIDDYDITNVRVGTTNFSGIKTWKDGNSTDRPESITVKLLANGEQTAEQEVTEDENGQWIYSFTDLDKYDENGVEIEYTIDEVTVDGYATEIDGHNLTNVRVGTTSVDGEKIWKDDDSKDRPESITVKLLQNGKEINSQEVTAEDNWKYSFTDLDEFDENGVAYEYTVEEESVEGYETTIDGYDITNLRVGKTEVSGTKTWKDDNPQDRPESIKVNLLQNGVVVDTKKVTADDDWTYSFTDLNKYDEEGVAYEYNVKEHDVPGYKSEVDGFDITNTRSEKKSIEVTKGWLDDNSENRPGSITVNLLQNGDAIEAAKITAENDWTYEFTNLDAYDKDGKAYIYTVEEEALEGYETQINGFDITNIRTGKTEVSGTKTWKDDNSKDRPEEITVNLLQNGKEIDTTEVTAETNWTYSFTDLDKFDEYGVAYEYTVEEKAVKGYESTVEGYDITNTLIKGSVELTKVDKDDKNIVLSGAEFKLVDSEGNTIHEGLTTDKNGKLVVKNLKPGAYQFVETKAPNGYELDQAPIEFTIELGQTEQAEVTVFNKKTPEPVEPIDPGKPEKPGTDTSVSKDSTSLKDPEKIENENKLPKSATNLYNYIFAGILLFISGIATLFIYRRKKEA